MTERTIEHTARELAGEFYDLVRSAEKVGEKVHIRKSSTGRAVQQIDPLAFCRSYPTVKDYLAGRKHGLLKHDRDGTVSFVSLRDAPKDLFFARMGGREPYRCPNCMELCFDDVPGWLHWYDQARQMLIAMLNNPLTHAHLKQGIYDALLEDRTKQYKTQEARAPIPNITQRHSLEN